MTIGSVSGVAVGTLFPDRRTLYDDGIHRALQAGIVGKASEGAESIVLSGGYADDEDYGDEIIYTGAGGRDPNSGRQIADQELAGHNQSLVRSCLNGTPVRVVRGSSHRSTYSPSQGYSYDGLFRVEDYWSEVGKDGFFVCRYRLIKYDIQPSLPQKPLPISQGSNTPSRSTTIVQRIVRDTRLGRQVKELYGHKCQVCGVVLDCTGGVYAEAAHIRPLGRPHNGPDIPENILCLCPNHHILFDRGGFVIEDNCAVSPGGEYLAVRPEHNLSTEHLRYHRDLWRRSTR